MVVRTLDRIEQKPFRLREQLEAISEPPQSNQNGSPGVQYGRFVRKLGERFF